MTKIRKIFTILIFQLIFFSALATAREKYDVALCAIFQNEAPYLKEWIEFHKLVGIEHFYLYNNLSNDDYQTALEPYIKSGLVELIEWPYKPSELVGWNSIQCRAYNDAVKRSRYKAKWLAVLDTDEFLFPVKENTLSEFLAHYRGYGGVVVNWQMYGTSNVEKILPGQLMIEKLLIKARYDYNENVHVKSIVRPKHVKEFQNPHYANYHPGYHAINSNYEYNPGPFCSPVLIDKIRINHYWARDIDFFNRVKIPRRQVWQDGGIFDRLNNLNQESDPAILKYVPALKKSL